MMHDGVRKGDVHPGSDAETEYVALGEVVMWLVDQRISIVELAAAHKRNRSSMAIQGR